MSSNGLKGESSGESGTGGGAATPNAAGSDAADSLTQDQKNAAVAALLQHCREGVAANNHDQALASLLHVVRITQGEDAIVQFLDAAKLRAQKEAESKARIEAAERRLDEEALQAAQQMSEDLAADDSTLLAQRGKTNILQEAFENGSSVVCRACNALVPRARYAQHRDFWCDAAPDHDSSDGSS